MKGFKGLEYHSLKRLISSYIQLLALLLLILLFQVLLFKKISRLLFVNFEFIQLEFITLRTETGCSTKHDFQNYDKNNFGHILK